MSTLFGWVHLSDIHIGHGGENHQADQSLVLGKLREDVAAQIAAGTPKPNAVFVTGDIAFSGACRDSKEYENAARWIGEIAQAAGVPLSEVYVVPGNHDVQRPVDKGMFAASVLRALRRGESHVDDALADATTRAHLAARQGNYFAFAEAFAPAGRRDPTKKEPRLHWNHVIELERVRVRLCGLNTALLAADEEIFGTDLGALWLGKRQLADALVTTVAENEVVIMLSHHPFVDGWLNDQKEAFAWIRSRAHVHLSGHVHDADNARTISGSGSDFVHIVAGAAHGEAEPKGAHARHGYNFGGLVAVGNAIELHLWPRRWSSKRMTFLRDVEVADDATGIATHTISRVRLPPQRVPPPPPPPPRRSPSDNPRISVDESVIRAEADILALLRAHPSVVACLRTRGFDEDPASMARALLHGRDGHSLAVILNHVLAELIADPAATSSDRKAVQRLFNECLRFASNWREVQARGRELFAADPATRRGTNVIELPLRRDTLAELILAGIDDRAPAFDLREGNPVVGLTHVTVPTILRSPVALTQERFVEAMVKHLADSEFSDLVDARETPSSIEAIDDVEGALHARGYERPPGEASPYYVAFGSKDLDLWKVACDAQKLDHGLPSLRLVRITGQSDSNETGLVENIKDFLKRKL